MAKVRIAAFSISLDGFGAGPAQSLDHPMGTGAEDLHAWFRQTRTFRDMIGQPGGTTGPDDAFARRSFENVGAWVMGRNMFGPVRGPWPDHSWRGWWGETPPYRTSVFVLTHHARPPLAMDGGTTFHFVTEGLGPALARARAAAGDRDVRVGGGVSTVRQGLTAGLIDQMHLVYSPVYLGRGETLLAGLDLSALGFEVSERVLTDRAVHVVLDRPPDRQALPR